MDVRIFFNMADVLGYWQELEGNSEHSPFQTATWSAISQSAGADCETGTPVFAVVFECDRPVALFPFVLARDRLATSIRWLAADHADYNGPIIARNFAARMPRDLLATVLATLRAQLPAVSYASLIRIPQFYPGIAELFASTGRLIRESHDSHALALRKNWREQYRQLRSGDTRRRLNTRLAGLRREGDYRFTRVRTPSERVAVAEQMMQWKADRLEAAGHRNPFGRADRGTPLRRTVLLTASSADAPAEMFAIYLNGTPVAAMLALLSGTVFHDWISSFDPATKPRFSVGTLLHLKTMELAARSGFARYDFLMGDEAYKMDWCDIRIPLWHYLVAFDARGSALCAAVAAHHSALTAIIRSPRIARAVRNGRKLSRTLRSRT